MPPPPAPTPGSSSSAPCRHTVVRVVSRNEDAEFVECQACGDIFDSIEYEDMAREDALAQAGDNDTDTPVPPRKHGRPGSPGPGASRPSSSRRR